MCIFFISVVPLPPKIWSTDGVNHRGRETVGVNHRGRETVTERTEQRRIYLTVSIFSFPLALYTSLKRLKRNSAMKPGDNVPLDDPEISAKMLVPCWSIHTLYVQEVLFIFVLWVAILKWTILLGHLVWTCLPVSKMYAFNPNTTWGGGA